MWERSYKKIDDVILFIVGMPTLFMITVTSRGFTVIKILLISLTTLLCFSQQLIRRVKIQKKNFVIYIGIFIAYYMFSLLFGIVKGYKFSLSEDFSLLQYYLFTPVIVAVISCSFFEDRKRSLFLKNALTYLTLFIVTMDVMKLLSYKRLIPDIDIFNLILLASNQDTDKLALRVSNEYCLMFLLPYFVVLLFLEKCTLKKRIIYMSITIIGTIYCLLSGRKILELVFFGSIMFMLFYVAFKKRKLKTLLLGILAAVVTVLILGKLSNKLNIGNIIEFATKTLEKGLSGKAWGVVKRKDNIIKLFEMWLKSPLIGNGLNAYAIDSMASSRTYWSYEVFYNALLAQTGLIGIVLLFYGIYYIISAGIRKFKVYGSPVYFAVAMGFLCFVICGATNPLLYNAWPWIIALIIVENKFDTSIDDVYEITELSFKIESN